MFHSLLPFVIIIIVLLVVSAVIKIVLRQRAREPQNYLYEKMDSLFSPAERSFFGALEQAVNGRYRFMGKVRLADVVRVKGGMNKGSWQNAFNRIQSKHVDIVACDPATLNIQLVVELDDSTTASREDKAETSLLRMPFRPLEFLSFMFRRKRGIQHRISKTCSLKQG